MAVFLSGQQFQLRDGGLFVSNAHLPAFAILTAHLPPVQASVASLDQRLEALPAGAIVRSARVTVSATAPGNTPIGDVAQVRAARGDPDASSSSLVVDFQGLRTVSALKATKGIKSVQPWQGTKFGEAVALGSTLDRTLATFDEILAERLLLALDSAVAPPALAAGGTVVIPTPPADLELIVNGTRAWFHAGPARPGESGVFELEVDLTTAVGAALATGPVPVVVTLRSAVPGLLGLATSLDFLKTHQVAFPEQLARELDAPEEGPLTLELPLPPESSEWLVREVQLTASARLGAARVLPAVGPLLSTDAALALDADRAAVVGLPPGRLGALETLGGVRLPLQVGPDGAELAGTLLADAGGTPGDPLPQGQLGPITLEPGEKQVVVWTTLPLARPRRLVAGEGLWIALQLARGSVVWPLAVLDPDERLNAPLRRRLPSGTYRPLSTAAGVATSAGALRVVGEAPANAPLPALEARVTGTPDSVLFTPTADGVRVALRLVQPAGATTPGALVDSVLRMALVASAPGSFSFGSVQVAYT